MPRLRERWPHMGESLNRAAELLVETREILEAYAEIDLATIQNDRKDTVSVSGLLALDPFRRRLALRYWLRSLGLPPPSRDHLARIDREVLQARPDRHPRLKIGRYEIKRRQKNLSVEVLDYPVEAQILDIS